MTTATKVRGDLFDAQMNRSEDRETLQVTMRAIAELPPAQRTVIRMRDIEGYRPDDVCEALAVSPGNQRVLPHRACSRVRAALEAHFDG